MAAPIGRGGLGNGGGPLPVVPVCHPDERPAACYNERLSPTLTVGLARGYRVAQSDYVRRRGDRLHQAYPGPLTSPFDRAVPAFPRTIDLGAD